MRNSIIVTFLLTTLWSSTVIGQRARQPGAYSNARGFPDEKSQALNTTAFLRLSKLSSDYRLGAGDVIEIEIVGQDTLNQALRAVRITNSGEISIPYLGAVQAANLTAAELEAAIGTRLQDRKLLQKPEVLVYVSDYQAKPIFVVGEVDNPGEYVMTEELTFTEAILMAGGIDFGADRYGFLHRRKSAESPDWKPGKTIEQPEAPRAGREVIKIDLDPLKKGGVLKPDIQLRAGDVIAVPTRRVTLYSIIGDVKTPGSYEVGAGPLLASQAISRAGGPSPTAKADKGLLIRYEQDGKRSELRIDFNGILKGKKSDFEIRPNDIIFVPGSRAKTLEFALLGVVPNTVLQQSNQSIQKQK